MNVKKIRDYVNTWASVDTHKSRKESVYFIHGYKEACIDIIDFINER